MKLSILDQSPISAGKTAQEALEASVALAKKAEELGYTRYWIAEHHDMKGLACPSPDVMIGVIGVQTNSIRIGAGAVLLPHYQPFRVAETYNLLATLFPDRIDLGIGRAPGGSAEATMALSTNFLAEIRNMPQSLDDLHHFLHRTFPEDEVFAKVSPTPVPRVSPETWLLGTSGKSGVLAAEKGMRYTFGHFMSNENGPEIIEKYNKGFELHHPNQRAQSIVALSVVCAETTSEAEEIALSSLLWKTQQAIGSGEGVPTVKEAKAYPYSSEDVKSMNEMKQKMIIGNPQEVKGQLLHYQQVYNVDEFMIVTITHDYKAREKSYELIANELLR